MGIVLQRGNVNQVLARIRGERWASIQKEVVAAIWSALVYHTWRARNWKIVRRQIIRGEATNAEWRSLVCHSGLCLMAKSSRRTKSGCTKLVAMVQNHLNMGSGVELDQALQMLCMESGGKKILDFSAE
ncbi:hypothetical protein CQW23_30037 [Capsicum baccatum]|uniref:Uncharacterized protein n=1 Tax=Capsicum baccatum TaxID=33114 RepID=A0A2G2VBK5_CAPBA|nr:hypothetical protein CQW23_30037 [Capsicum baccatum]